MKSLLKTLFIFLIFIFTLCLTPQSEAVSDTQSIQNDYQKIVLVSNTMNQGQMFTETKVHSSSSVLNIDNILYKNSSCNTNNFIHKLSTDKKTNIEIRAP